MEFEYWTNRWLDNFRLFQYWTSPVFRFPLFCFLDICGLSKPVWTITILTCGHFIRESVYRTFENWACRPPCASVITSLVIQTLAWLVVHQCRINPVQDDSAHFFLEMTLHIFLRANRRERAHLRQGASGLEWRTSQTDQRAESQGWGGIALQVWKLNSEDVS